MTNKCKTCGYIEDDHPVYDWELVICDEFTPEDESKSIQSPKILVSNKDKVSGGLGNRFDSSDTFCLKDKIYGGLHEHIDLKDVKEFIKILKKFANRFEQSCEHDCEIEFCKKIDELTGDLE